jgi:hypothetical protein
MRVTAAAPDLEEIADKLETARLTSGVRRSGSETNSLTKDAEIQARYA